MAAWRGPRLRRICELLCAESSPVLVSLRRQGLPRLVSRRRWRIDGVTGFVVVGVGALGPAGWRLGAPLRAMDSTCRGLANLWFGDVLVSASALEAGGSQNRHRPVGEADMPVCVVGTADYDTLKSVDGILELVTYRDVSAYGERRAAVVVATVALLPNFLLGGEGEGAKESGGDGGLTSGRFGGGRGDSVVGGGAVRLAPRYHAVRGGVVGVGTVKAAIWCLGASAVAVSGPCREAGREASARFGGKRKDIGCLGGRVRSVSSGHTDIGRLGGDVGSLRGAEAPFRAR